MMGDQKVTWLLFHRTDPAGRSVKENSTFLFPCGLETHFRPHMIKNDSCEHDSVVVASVFWHFVLKM